MCQAQLEETQTNFVAFEALLPVQEDRDWVVNKATCNPDTMYLHEALREPDRAQFLTAMQKEMGNQIANGNYQFTR